MFHPSFNPCLWTGTIILRLFQINKELNPPTNQPGIIPMLSPLNKNLWSPMNLPWPWLNEPTTHRRSCASRSTLGWAPVAEERRRASWWTNFQMFSIAFVTDWRGKKNDSKDSKASRTLGLFQCLADLVAPLIPRGSKITPALHTCWGRNGL
jgi:hypothetical protein